MSTEHIDPDTFFSGGAPSAKFETVGTTISGTITERPEVAQQTDLDTGELKEWDNGDPMMQLIVTVQTGLSDPDRPGDDGLRKFYVKAKLKAAVEQALREAGVRKLAVGGVLSVTYTADAPPNPKKRNLTPAKLYSAAYTPPADAFLAPAAGPIAAIPQQVSQRADAIHQAANGWTPPADMPEWEAAALLAMPDGQRNALLALDSDQRKQFLPSA